VDGGAALTNEIDAGDAAIDDAILDVLGYVGGSDEQHLDRRVATRKGERAVTRLLRAKPGVLEKPKRRFAQSTLGRDRDPQEAARSSASR
jgi:6-phosphofructokinase